jgi:cob(I)alamin adenosyltransferase
MAKSEVFVLEEKGIVILYTGQGRGKTTAALGLCMRVAGWGKKVCIIQFFKSEDFVCGEKIFCREKGIELHSMGIGYTWKKTPQEQKDSLQIAWKLAEEKLQDKSYDLVVLDEVLHVFQKREYSFEDILTEEKLIQALQNRLVMDVVLTGRGASERLIDFSDMVTEMVCIKHPWQKGIAARKGMEY